MTEAGNPPEVPKNEAGEVKKWALCCNRLLKPLQPHANQLRPRPAAWRRSIRPHASRWDDHQRCVQSNRRETRRQAEGAILQYLNGFYTPRRRHASLGGKSPLVFERKAA